MLHTNTVYVTLGEPHIDGEPGDLRFRIKVFKYEWALIPRDLDCALDMQQNGSQRVSQVTT